jgi:hypothetical protein
VRNLQKAKPMTATSPWRIAAMMLLCAALAAIIVHMW